MVKSKLQMTGLYRLIFTTATAVSSHGPCFASEYQRPHSPSRMPNSPYTQDAGLPLDPTYTSCAPLIGRAASRSLAWSTAQQRLRCRQMFKFIVGKG
ncbi:hypothetical protein SAICODRAFT_129175 [Saitoella complicata NRRL Y-17804]|uniref:uncharacterized protein n=1 Tax=Saitoella complicata (strain BCRC 22490 / CBS 7301 / JCM 7358 / NBRC 10748 / NRRL Y-17804) TaxID=698492 RepID=UPI000867868E|nr:uncharacterized protein SAICODRAFT_129175 [Saitoella complicata NRRL Y-17804]ODQ52461.1 hypothetical protein SAICODRAFT_129175 [Saitoella complicata NRRL Y-17804]